ncbi:MAG TPA: DNA methyltransferase [Ktedonobacteraceae bacterium]
MKRFYTLFKHEYAAFLASFEGSGTREERERYAALLLNSTIFVYFLQRKGLLDAQGEGVLNGDRNYLLHRLEMLQNEYGRGHFHAFYRALLRRLFSRQAGAGHDLSEMEELLGAVPVLPYGLLDIDRFEQAERAIVIPDEAYEQLFRFLDTFEWSLEDQPARVARGLSPDVMGAIFEKYSHQKQMGAYYTREDITEYMSAASIIPRFFEHIVQKCPDLFDEEGAARKLLRTEGERYIYAAMKHGCALALPTEIEAGLDDVAQRVAWDQAAPGEYALPLETWREVVARRQRYEQVSMALARGEIDSIDALVTWNLDLRQFARDFLLSTRRASQLAVFYTNLVNLTVLDPTCGSGEFLLAALAVLEPLYAACIERMQALIGVQVEALEVEQDTLILREILDLTAYYLNSRAFIVRSIITRNLYGVDLMREATEICKLRLFLELVARVETCAEVKVLSEIDFNIRAGNALVGFAHLSEIRRMGERDLEGLLFSREALPLLLARIQEIESRCAELQDARQRQALEPAELVRSQWDLRALLVALRDELDRYLASAYGIDRHNLPDDEARARAFARWRASFEPLHWIVEWYEITRRGGFDVIIGNPPYVAHSQVRQRYQARFYETQACGNLCAYVLERGLTLLTPGGRCGMIVPVSTIASVSYRSLSQLLLRKQLWISSYSNRPGKLFAGVEQRLAIVLLRNGEKRAVFASAYRHWYEPERAHLFATLHYAAASTWQPAGTLVKSGSELAEAIFARMTRRQGFPLLHCRQPAAAVWVHNGPTYWVRALPFEPNTGQKSARSDHYCQIPAASQEAAYALAAILSSSTFYFFYKLVSNCRDLGKKELHFFPLGQLHAGTEARLARLGQLLAQSLQKNAERRVRHYTSAGMAYETSYEEYYPARAKTLLDKIDSVLAEHYGFSDEELDFLLHYDGKYRQSGKTEA